MVPLTASGLYSHAAMFFTQPRVLFTVTLVIGVVPIIFGTLLLLAPKAWSERTARFVAEIEESLFFIPLTFLSSMTTLLSPYFGMSPILGCVGFASLGYASIRYFRMADPRNV